MGECGFCRICGPNPFYQVAESGEHFPSAGAFDDPVGFSLDVRTFLDEPPVFDDFAQQTRAMTDAELFAPCADAKGD